LKSINKLDMSQINFNFAVDSENSDHLLIIGEMFLKLAGSEVPVKSANPAKPASKKVETPKVETPKVETPKVETPKVEAEEKGLTIEALRAKGFALATAKPAAKEAIGNWLKERNIKGVPALPKEMFQEYDEFLSTL
jgi:hypothetical protein